MFIPKRDKLKKLPALRDWRSVQSSARKLEVQIRMNERERIARELHDSTSQLIVALQLQLIRLRKSSCVLRSDVFDNVMAELEDVVAELHDGVRQSTESEPMDGGRLGKALSGMATEFARRTGLVVETAIGRIADELPSDVAGALFRVSQEALANACTHARPTRVCLSVTGDSALVTLRVVDDGIGFHVPQRERRTGHGLSNMRVRVHEIGGQLTIRNLKRGAVVQAKIKLIGEEAAQFTDPRVDKIAKASSA